MKRKILSALLVMLMVVSLAPISSLADTAAAYAVEGGNIYFDKATGEITDCDSAVTKAVIPSKISGISVTSVGNNAFNNCSKLTSVVLPDGVTRIGNNAFYFCESLVSVDIPDSVSSIGDGAFYSCRSLAGIEIPNGVTYIGSEAFCNCASLTHVTLPSGINCIFYSAFQDCTGLTGVTIQNNVLYIYGSAFQGCKNLKSVTIPNGTVTIDDSAFDGCAALRTVNLPKSIKTIGNAAFRNCGGITDVNYAGTAEEWKLISIESGNDALAKAAINYGSGEEASSFTDVSSGEFYYEAVQWAVSAGITDGTGNNKFEPSGSCTRAQIVTFLWRAAGKPTVSQNISFTDVKPGAFYYEAVKWAVANEITNGTGGNKFSPDAVCTRGETVTFLYRANGSPAVSGGSGFSDVASSAFYNNAVIWAVANEITNGTGGGKFSPNDTCTRGQVVTFLYRVH